MFPSRVGRQHRRESLEGKGLHGATRRDRTGDLLITNRKELINQRLTRKVTE